ncbi:enhancer of AG-4 protein 2-like, partial [Trifolium pratense]
RAFVAPPDIQAFTSEYKNKLTARLQGKTKYFAQAVKEICAAFDEIQKQKSSGDDTDDSRIGSEAPPVDEAVGNSKDTTDAMTSDAEKDNIYGSNVGSNLEDCLPKTRERGNLDEKLTESGRPKESFSGSEIKKNSSKPTVKGASNVNDFGQHDNGNSVSTNGSKPRKLLTGSKKKSEVADNRNKNGGSTGTLLKVGNSTGSGDLSRSREAFKTGKGKDTSAVKSDSPDTLRPGSNGNTGEKSKNLISKKASLEVKNELQEIMFDAKESDGKNSIMGKKNQVHAKHNVGANESLHATKKLKRMDARDELPSGHIPKDVKSPLPCSTSVEDKSSKMLELKRSTSNSKGKSSVHELVPVIKQHSQVQKTMPDSDTIAFDEKKEWNNLKLKGDTKNVMTKQVQRKRKAVCLHEDDDVPKTPVHGGAAKNMKSPFATGVKKGNNAHSEKSDAACRNSSQLEDAHLKEPSSQLHNDTSSIKHPEKVKADEVNHVHVPHSHDKLDSKQFPSKVAKVSSASPVKSPHPVPPATKSNAERNAERSKSSKPMVKASSIATQKKADNGSSKSLLNLSSSQNPVSAHKKKLASSAEISKTTPKTLPQAVDVPVSTVDFKELDALHVDRFEEGMVERSDIYIGSGNSETSKNMKHLIAAAQAKWKKAHSQYLSSDMHHVQGGTPSPSTVQPFFSVSSNFAQTDVQGVHEHTTSASPPTNEYHSVSQNQLDADEIEERRVGSVQRGPGGSLSGDTEAAVARDAFEGMIETLSRTKESIGRATRLAIDCAKYGIANERARLSKAARDFEGSRSQTRRSVVNGFGKTTATVHRLSTLRLTDSANDD